MRELNGRPQKGKGPRRDFVTGQGGERKALARPSRRSAHGDSTHHPQEVCGQADPLPGDHRQDHRRARSRMRALGPALGQLRLNAALGLPKNAATGRQYSGINILILSHEVSSACLSASSRRSAGVSATCAAAMRDIRRMSRSPNRRRHGASSDIASTSDRLASTVSRRLAGVGDAEAAIADNHRGYAQRG